MQVAEYDEVGDLAVRDCLVVGFFCQRPHAEIVGQVREVFEHWLARMPDEACQWALVGPDADEVRAVNPRLLSRARAQLDPAKAKRDLYALALGGPEEVNPAYRFAFQGANDLLDDETNFLELRLPSSAAEAERVEETVTLIREVAEKIPFDSGYASLALTVGTASQYDLFAEKTRGMAARYPGLDFPDNAATSSGLGGKLRGAYWLTFVGPAMLHTLGGRAALEAALAPSTRLMALGAGAMLRTGQLPTSGDVNRGDDLPSLRALAEVLEPVLLLGDGFLDNLFVDQDARARWERRFLD